MEDSTDEFVSKDSSKSFNDTGSDTAQEKSTEDSSFDNVTDEPVPDTVHEEESNDSSSSTSYQNEDSFPAHEQSGNSPSTTQIENVEYVPEHSVDSSNASEAKNSPLWQEQSSMTSEDSNVNESKNESAEKMETENMFEVETSPTKKEIKIDMNPLSESDLLGLENDVSDSDDDSKNDSQKSPSNSKVNCTDEDSMSLDAESTNIKLTINEDSVKSEDLADIEDVKIDEPDKTENMSVDEDDGGEDLLSKVNTNLPNTELSNADLSALEVAQPTEKLVNAQGASMETDLLDELSDFCGFEDRSDEKSQQALQIIRAERDQMLLALTRKLLDQYADNATDNDDASFSDESRNEGENTFEAPSSIAAADSSSTAAAVAAVSTTTPVTSTTVPSSATPVVGSATPATPSAESHIIFHKSTGSFVYALAKDVNIFEERVPSGSKRVKKRRKFFGFDEHADNASRSNLQMLQSDKPPEKSETPGSPRPASATPRPAPVTPGPPKEPENPLKIERNIVIENKENFLTPEKPREEPMIPPVPPAVEPVLPSPVLPPSAPKTQPKLLPPTPPAAMPSKIPVKPKRPGFDVSKPMYREPFKHGWRREIFYRDLPEGSKSKTAYISYFNDQNKKFKTIRQIVEHLPPGSELNEKHFTFSKERIFGDNEPGCENEIVRYQKDIVKEMNNSGPTSAMSLLNRLKKPDGSSPSPVHDPSKSKMSKKPSIKGDESDDEDTDTPSPSISKMAMPKILIRGVGPNSTKAPSIKTKLSLGKPSSGLKKVIKSKKPPEKSLKPKGSITEDGDGAAADYDRESMSHGLSGAGTSLTTPMQNSHSLKRRHSNESDSSIRRAKMARLDAEADQFPYRSSLTLSNISFLYEPLILCFKYLTVKELLRVSMSCKYLNRVASDSALWSTVRLKNSKITDWDGFARTLRKHRTKRLDMWKMLSPTSPEDVNVMWDDFCRVIPSVTSLERIDLMRCPSKVVQTAAESCHNLTVINALQLNKNGSLSLSSFTKLKHLRELRLKGFPSISLEASDRLKFVRTDSLQVLSLTNVKNLNMDTLDAISRLNHLRVLELGECETLSHNFTDILTNLKRLERLRLEKVVNLDPDYRMFSLLKDLRHFRSLELINCEVKIGFDEALAHCRNLEEFLLIPLYKTQSATANKVIVNGIQKLSETLKKFVWGLTTELLKVTDIFVQEYQMKAASKTEGSLETNNGNKVVARKGQADSIPILKHLSEHVEKPEVDILTIAQLEKMLISLLPAARVKVLKIPFNTTGRQSLSDCFK